MNRTVLFGTLLLLLVLVPATPVASAADTCVGVAPELGGPAACVERKSGCATLHSAYLREQVCLHEFLDLVLP